MIDTKILSQKTVFKSRHFHVDHVEIERSGQKFEKDIIEQTPTVLIIPYSKDEIYLEQQYRDALEKTCLEVVAGHIDENEDPLTAAKRELEEETGLKAKTWHKIATWNVMVTMRAKVNVFFATDLEEGISNLQHDEVIELVKIPLKQVLDKIESGGIPGASHIAALLLFDKMKKEGKI
jgi:ADP-ribose pyrophosphatase